MRRVIIALLALLSSACATRDVIKPWTPAELQELQAIPRGLTTSNFNIVLEKPRSVKLPRIHNLYHPLATTVITITGTGPEVPPGDACTVGPFSSSTTVTQISNTINSLSTNPTVLHVVCLTRGQNWSSGSGLNLTTSFTNSKRVTICASTGSSCTDSGAPNPVISITGSAVGNPAGGPGGVGINFETNSGGYNFRNIDFTNANAAATSNIGRRLRPGVHDVTFFGGTYTGWYRYLWSLQNEGGTIPRNFQVGVCAAAPGCATTCGVGQERWINALAGTPSTDSFRQTGPFDDSTFSIYTSGMNQHDSRDHILDFDSGDGTNLSGTTTSDNITLQCSNFDGSTGGGTLIDLSWGRSFIGRYNLFKGAGCAGSAFGLQSHGPDPRTWGWIGAQIYGNEFDFTSCGGQSGPGVVVTVGQNVDIFGNIMRSQTTLSGNQRGLVQFSCNDNHTANGGGDLNGSNIRVFNNTAYRTGTTCFTVIPGTCDFGQTGWSIIGADGTGACGGGAPAPNIPTNITVVNNLTLEDDANLAKPVLFFSTQNCSYYGTNGDQIHNNFVYTTGSSASVANCSASVWTSGGPTNGNDGGGGVNEITGEFATAPGLNGDGSGYTGVMQTAFTPINNTSPVCGRGDPAFVALTGGAGFGGAPFVTNDIGAIPCPP